MGALAPSDYSFPSSLQGPWIDGLFPLSKLGILLGFRSLSYLSLTIYPDWGLSPEPESSLEFPCLERLRVQRDFRRDRRGDIPITMKIPKLRHLRYVYNLELDLEDPPEDPGSWLGVDEYPVLQEVQIYMAIHLVPTFGSIHPVVKRTQPERQRVLWRRTHA